MNNIKNNNLPAYLPSIICIFPVQIGEQKLRVVFNKIKTIHLFFTISLPFEKTQVAVKNNWGSSFVSKKEKSNNIPCNNQPTF